MATTTFLFVDQVGSTEQLTRLGDRAAQQVRRALFDLLRQATEVHGGHEVDFTGDGLFCAFEGAADAVDAAVAMQQLVAAFNARRGGHEHLAVRIGLHTGEPLVSEGGGYFGAAVVVAARLCSRAEAGQILASDLVRALLAPRGEPSFAAVGPARLKGLPDEMDVYAVEWAWDPRPADLPGFLSAHRGGAFVGREDELAAIETAWAGLAEGGRRLVLVGGEQGMGVSRLLAEAADRLRRQGASVWAGGGQGPDVPFAPWVEAVTSWVATVSRAELRLTIGSRGPDLVRLVPGVADLVPGLAVPTRVDPAADVFLIADAVDELAARWSVLEPLVVVLDELDRADAASITVLRRVLTSRRGGRVLVLAGHRPATVGASRLLGELDGVGSAAELLLSGLTPPQVRELVGAVVGDEPGEVTVSAVLAESQGSPLFVLQMARSMRREGVEQRLREAVDRTGEARTDLLLWREELALGLRELDRLREEETAPAPAVVEPDGTPPAPGGNPYRGLLPFRTEDAERFAGRDALVAEMVAALVASSWLAVVGASGSGKSSAVRAGLLPALARGAIDGSDRWGQVVVTPGADAGLLGAAIGSGERTVLVVDQFEELWTTDTPEDRTAVLDRLVMAAADPQRSTLVVVVLRADYYGRTAEHPGLAGRMAESQVLVPPMSPAELRAAVEAPVRVDGWVLEAGLARTVVEDVAGEPGALPLLSTAMAETWERRRGRSLTLAGYAESGGARRAIAQLADSTLQELSEEEQEVARRLLLRLAAPAEDGSDVARPAPLVELVGDERTAAVLARLADRRLVVVGESTAQVAHEALLREWPRLRGWLAADREGRRLHQQIATAATQWEAAGRDDDGLLRGARLAAADDWRADHDADLSPREREFLAASVDARGREMRRAKRTTRRFQVLAAVLVVLLAGAAVATGFAVVSGRDASSRANESLARGLAAQATSLAPTQLDLALLLAVEAHRHEDSENTRTGLLTTLNASRYLQAFRRELPPGVVSSAVARAAPVLVIATSTELRVFDTDSWEQRGPAWPLTGQLTGVDVSPDGRRIAVGDGGGLHLSEIGAPRLGPPVGGVGSFRPRFGGDGRWLLVLDESLTSLTVLDTDTTAVLGTAQTADDVSYELARPGHDEFVLVGLNHGVVQRFAVDGSPMGTADLTTTLEHPGSISDVAYTPDGSHLVVLDNVEHLEILDAETLRRAPLAEGGPDTIVPGGDSIGASSVASLSMSPSGTQVALGRTDGTVEIIHLFAGVPVARLTGQAGGNAVARWLDEDRLLVVWGSAGAEYDLGDETPLGVERADLAATNVVTDPEGNGFLLVDYQGPAVRELDASLRDVGPVPAPPLDPPSFTTGSDLALSPDGATAAFLLPVVDPQTGASQGDPVLFLVDRRTAETQRIPLDIGGDLASGESLAFSPDGRRLALIDESTGQVRTVDVASGRLGEPLGEGLFSGAVAWHDDDTLLLGGSGGLSTVDAETGDVRGTADLGGDLALLTDLVPLPDGRTFAAGSGSGRVFLVDSTSLEQTREPLTAGAFALTSIGVSRNGRYVAAAGTDGGVRIWDLRTGRTMGPALASSDTFILGLAFSGDDRHLVTSGNQIVSWDLDPDHWAATACRLAGRDLTRAEWATYLPDQPYRATCGS